MPNNHRVKKDLSTLLLISTVAVTAVGSEPRLKVDGRIATLDGAPCIPQGMIHAGNHEGVFDQMRQLGVNTYAWDLNWDAFDSQKPAEENLKRVNTWKHHADLCHSNGINLVLMFSLTTHLTYASSAATGS